MRERIQKSDMTAETGYDLRRLEEDHHLLLPCKIEEEKETICMSFDLRGMQMMEETKKLEKSAKLALLLAAAELEELYMRYEFTLEPENLYYDILGRVKVKRRDVIPPGGKDRMKSFLRQYQALIGYMMDGSRPYEDYLYGGFEILNAKSAFAVFFEPETMQEERKLLLESYESLLEDEKKYTKRVEVKKYRRLVRFCVICVLLLLTVLVQDLWGYL